MRLRIASALVLFMSFSLMIFAGCSYSYNTETMKFSYSGFDGTETKDITLNPDEKNLNLSGTINMKTGKAELTLKAKNTAEVLFSKEYTAESCGDVAINLNDLKGNRELLFELKCEKVKNFNLELNSQNRMSTDSHDKLQKEQ